MSHGGNADNVWSITFDLGGYLIKTKTVGETVKYFDLVFVCDKGGGQITQT